MVTHINQDGCFVTRQAVPPAVQDSQSLSNTGTDSCRGWGGCLVRATACGCPRLSLPPSPPHTHTQSLCYAGKHCYASLLSLKFREPRSIRRQSPAEFLGRLGSESSCFPVRDSQDSRRKAFCRAVHRAFSKAGEIQHRKSWLIAGRGRKCIP